MNGPAFSFGYLSDPRLAAQALSPMPAWLWSADASRVLWANPTAAAIFNAPSPAALAAREFETTHPAAAQIARLALTLPHGGAPRLERLRGFGAGVGAALTCLCSRITLADNATAIFVIAGERAGPDLPLPERVRRLLDGGDKPAAAFTADGELIDATPDAIGHFSQARDLVTLGAQNLAQDASHNGHAEGELAGAAATLDRLGAGAAVVLFATFAAPFVAQLAVVAQQSEAALPVVSNVAPVAPVAAVPAAEPAAKRRAPLRFVWQIDSAGIFTLHSDEFIHLAGPKTAGALNAPWAEAAATLDLDPDGKVANALATKGTWSGITVQWPADGLDETLPVELSGLPTFDRDRNFSGYRGFGVCRDLDRLAALEIARAKPPEPPPAPAPQPEPQPEPPAETPPANVLQFPAASVEPGPALSPGEHRAFDELARELGDRLKNAGANAGARDDFASSSQEPPPPKPPRNGDGGRNAQEGRPILDRLPVGILVYRLNDLIYANRAFLDWTGYPTLEALAEAGGLDSLFIENNGEAASKNSNGARTLTISTLEGEQIPVEGKLFSVTWNGESALVLMLNTAPANVERQKTNELALRRSEAEARELRAILDTATDGVVMLDRSSRVLSANRSAEALFGYESTDIAALTFGDLFAPESRRVVLEYLDDLSRDSAAGLLASGKEVIGRVRQGGLIPLFMTMGRVGDDGEKFCAVLRDITAWKKTEDELVAAKQQAEKASFAKSEFLAKMSHEIRTPLNAIIGFSEVMMDERFGPIGNDRYRQYLRDIHSSGGHLISLLNDLLDLSKIEAGKLDLTFVNVNLNDVTQQCVAIMQQQANRERVIIRTSLAPSLPQVVADLRSVRQIMLNLLSNSIKFTGAGGQVIISTALTDAHEVVLRVRDTGAGMSEKELQTALEPFRQLATSVRWGSSGTGLGLPITKALTEANFARFNISSVVNDGTLVEIAFPASRLLAQ